ncbi:isochorismatase family protein [Novosphingobium rosa]|uniref:isochorismatase family protein n=1 Tax=Novosphingobium rosa TaxID=76978 RepID=UPI00082A0FB7|nr:isochorismatase family protein [Novosphingobium rosa]
MTVTTLDPKTALIVIDLQKGIVTLPCAHPMADVVAQSATLLAAFRQRDLPVVLVNVTGLAPGRAEHSMGAFAFPPDFADLVPELDRQPQDILITKRTWGAFTNTALEAELRARGVTQLVLCGVATTAGVESTARFAHELGFNVTLATDAMTDMSLEAHENSLARIFPRLGESGTVAQIIALLEARG